MVYDRGGLDRLIFIARHATRAVDEYQSEPWEYSTVHGFVPRQCLHHRGRSLWNAWPPSSPLAPCLPRRLIGLLSDGNQPATLDRPIKGDVGLIKHPGLYSFVMNAKKVDGTADVVLLPDALRCMALNLGTDATRNVQPLTKARKGAPKAL